MEALTFYNSITKGTPLVVEPEQACVVSQILEAIYISAKTGKPYYFS
jgi:predicted dehydrogenase